jgi:hypothetical protein
MKVDYLMGRLVTAVADAITEEEDWDWVIVFEGEARLGHKGNAPAPSPAIDGTTLGTVTEKASKTTMEFYGGSPATLVQAIECHTNTLYIKLLGGETAPITPGAEAIDPEETRPPDLFNERINSGPQPA